ncbi:MAG: hypothetical protein AB7G75_18755 [Candidatus Binatia bacterium]
MQIYKDSNSPWIGIQKFSLTVFSLFQFCRIQVFHNQNGMALVLALVAMLMIAMLSLSGVVTSQGELQMAVNEQSAKRALDVADAGLRHTFKILGSNAANAYTNGFDDELSANGTGGSLASAGGTVVTLEDGNDYRFFPFGGSGGTDGYYVRAVDNFDDADQTTDLDQKIIIIARGRIGTAEKVIEAMGRPPVPCGITTGEVGTGASGSMDTGNIQINTVDGMGACIHSNGNLNINGHPSFPDGATATGNVTCVGSPTILEGGCENALSNQPPRFLPEINVGKMANWVAALGAAHTTGPYYILHTVTYGGYTAGEISRGGTCVTEDTSALATSNPSQSTVGRCTGGSVVAVAIPGVSIDAGNKRCLIDQNTPAGIYYCDGSIRVQGSISGNITLIARDNITMAAQTDIIHYLPKTSVQTLISGLMAGAIKDAAQEAYDNLGYRVLVAGADLDMSGGSKITMTGGVFIHNEIDMSGGKTITGYIFATDGKPTYAGDPHPPTPTELAKGVPENNVTGNSQVLFNNFDVNFPLGPPAMTAWNDDVR